MLARRRCSVVGLFCGRPASQPAHSFARSLARSLFAAARDVNDAKSRRLTIAAGSSSDDGGSGGGGNGEAADAVSACNRPTAFVRSFGRRPFFPLRRQALAGSPEKRSSERMEARFPLLFPPNVDRRDCSTV